jgi:hypothetical protein
VGPQFVLGGHHRNVHLFSVFRNLLCYLNFQFPKETVVFIHRSTNMECDFTDEENLNLRINISRCEQNVYTIHLVFSVFFSQFLYHLHMEQLLYVHKCNELSLTVFVKCLFAVTVCLLISGCSHLFLLWILCYSLFKHFLDASFLTWLFMI